eukprot:TRINITY_DN3154_c0_g1_i1.p2 TRINITY_DN3154_c0_g1~~TRINITY_DN3154_c0_g1_i1.p2  ORF type:complete len:102 (+),score=23.30 TRINITY_DN3154_c0_g1_i1:189-494(+)
MMDTNRLLAQVNAKAQFLDRERRRNQLTLKEMEDVKDDTKTYKAIGKMFMLVPFKSVTTELTDSVKKFENDLTQLANQQKYLQNQIRECEKGIRELIIQRT